MKKFISGEHLAVALLLILSAALRIYKLGSQSYWIDEMVSVAFTSWEGWTGIFKDNHPILYHFLLKIWNLSFGDSEAATRSLSVIFSVTTTYVVYLFAKALVPKDKRLWFFAGFLHALSSFSIIYAQETRMYALFELTSVFNLYCFYLTFFKNQKPKMFYISCVLLAFTHYGSLLIFAYEALFLLLVKRKIPKPLQYGCAAGLVILIVSFLLNFSWPGLLWQKLKFDQEPASRYPLEALIYLANLSPLLLLVFAVFFGVSLRTVYRKFNSETPVYMLFAGLIVFSLSSMEVMGLLFHRSLLLPRYFIFLNPPWILLFIFCLSKAYTHRAYFFAGLATLFAVLWLPKAYFETKAPWKRAAEIIRFESGERKILVLTTRTVTIQFPYLRKARVEKLTPDEIKDVTLLALKYPQYKTFWVLENYWGGYGYLPEFIEKLRHEKFKVTETRVQNPMSEPLTILQVQH